MTAPNTALAPPAPPDGARGFAQGHGLDAAFCLRNAALPVQSAGAVTLVRAEGGALAPHALRDLQDAFGRVCVIPADPGTVEQEITKTFAADLPKRTTHRVPDRLSCRSGFSSQDSKVILLCLATTGLVIALRWPGPAFAAVYLLVSALIVLSTLLKLAAALSVLRPMTAHTLDETAQEELLPTITILLPLLGEKEILGRLVERVSRLDYPHDKLDLCLVVEEDDTVTRNAVKSAQLPVWMRVIVVPFSTLKTKPRAMNYALDFARGSIVGIYDAEDAPGSDHLRQVAHAFAHAPANVVCFQGILDFYNARYNWLSRCFTIDYATWFRLILPGLRRLGLVLPLGGTTLFFRRDALEEIGCWDAHNVTEDADLGVRLARAGYRTDLLPIVTMEEANSAVWPWIKQRSRWLKGYAMTWAVHMRDPARLWRELGAWRFFGVQILLLGTLIQFLFSPLTWTFVVMAAGITHPVQAALGSTIWIFVAVMTACEVIQLVSSAIAVSGRQHRHLLPWLPLIHVYHALGTAAMVKALWELARNPFYWDKTRHGQFH